MTFSFYPPLEVDVFSLAAAYSKGKKMLFVSVGKVFT